MVCFYSYKMEKYKLVGIENPEKGIRKIVGQMGVVRINNAMSDEMAEYCIKNGMEKYFKEVEETEEEQLEETEIETEEEQLEELKPKEVQELPVNAPLPEVNAVQIVPQKTTKKASKK